MRYLIFWNLGVFAIYGIDKWKATHGKWRISERALLILAFLMGGFGAFLGMQIFRHKTKHIKFIIGVPLMIVINLVIIYLLGEVKL